MATTWQTVRVFISSTFRDMHVERDHLVKVVFPRLRQWCEQRRLHLVDIDLRWGVTKEDADNGKATEICLREIDDYACSAVATAGCQTNIQRQAASQADFTQCPAKISNRNRSAALERRTDGRLFGAHRTAECYEAARIGLPSCAANRMPHHRELKCQSVTDEVRECETCCW
jgi:hypothetical protein